MRVNAFITVGLVAVTVGLVAFWNLRGDSDTSSGAPALVTGLAEIASEPVDQAIDGNDESVNSEASRLEQSAVEEAVENQAIVRQQRIAGAIYETLGSRITQALIDSGLAPSDSAETVRRYATEMAECLDTTFVTEAARQSIPVEELFVAFEEAMDFGDLNPSDVPVSDVVANVSEVMDVSSMETNLLPCMVGALQEAGIPLQLVIEAAMDEFGFEHSQ